MNYLNKVRDVCVNIYSFFRSFYMPRLILLIKLFAYWLIHSLVQVTTTNK